MVESEAKGLSEEVMLGAVVFGHQQMQVAIRAIKELVARGGQAALDVGGAGGECRTRPAPSRCTPQAALAQAYSLTEKQQRHARLAEIKTQTLATLTGG